MKEFFAVAFKEPFYVPQEVYDHCIRNWQRESRDRGGMEEVMFAAYCQEYPEMDKLWNQYFDEKAAEKSYGRMRTSGSRSEKPPRKQIPQKSFWKDIKLYEGQLLP